MNILVTGGTGYIGSHTLVDLMDHGFNVIAVDNQSNSDLSVLESIKEITGKEVKNYSIDLCDKEKTRTIFQENEIHGVIHFAAFKSVNDSVSMPLEYYHNNLNSLLNVLSLMGEYKVNHFIFSSSCSVYGNTTDLPVTETTPTQEAECPYARTKQVGEKIVEEYIIANPGFKSILLRYFNPAGAHESCLMGESPINKAANLVPVITETGIGKRNSMTVFGNDYDTRDGSCIRDYIHVMDLANAHTKAMQYLIKNPLEKAEVVNLGIGEGVSVIEAIKAFESVSGIELNYQLGPRREGDVVAVYANKQKAEEMLAWKPSRNIEDIMRTAWNWEKKRSQS